MPELDKKPDLAKGAGDHGHGDHGHGDHGHGLPPPEPDHVNALNVVVWGLGTFVLIVISIFWLGGYFWTERDAEDLVKVHQSYVAPDLAQARQDARTHLTSVRKLENGRYQVPITHAMSLVASGK